VPEVSAAIRLLYQRCLDLGYHPREFRKAQVVMVPKLDRDPSTVKGWRPISLLSCLGKGLERLIGRRMAWATVQNQVLQPQQMGALPRRSAVDVVAALLHDIEAAMEKRQVATLVTIDVEGAFDAVLRNRLLLRLREQGWPENIVHWASSFMTDRHACVRHDDVVTSMDPLFCGLPQGSPASPILYLLYTEPIHRLGEEKSHFGYADDCGLLAIADTVEESARLAQDMLTRVLTWGAENAISFGPSKTEVQHFMLKRHRGQLPRIRHGSRDVEAEPAMRWLGVWLDPKLSFKRHVAEKAAAARRVANHIRGLSKVHSGAPPAAITKAMKAVVIPKALFASEVWYPGRTRSSFVRKGGQFRQVQTGLQHSISLIQKAINHALRGCLPVWKTTPLPALYREASVPPVEQLLDSARVRHAIRLRKLDKHHPLVHRSTMTRTTNGAIARPTILQSAVTLVQEFPRPVLEPPHYSGTSHEAPTLGLSKDKAAEDFQLWLERQPPGDIVAYSDGSKLNRWSSKAGYGFAVFRGKDLIAQGKGQFAFAEVFDAEAEGAWQALRTAVATAEQVGGKRPDITVCTDNTGVVSSINGTASASSQAAFIKFQRIAEQYRGKATIKWVPGHCDIQGNELADKLAKEGAEAGHGVRVISQPTLAYVKRGAKAARTMAFRHWWLRHQPGSYKDTGLLATLGPTAELQQLGRPLLHRLLAARSGHGDFAAYHRRFGHADASMTCSCGRQKSPAHIFYCRKLTNRESQVGFCRRKVAEEIGEKWSMFVERVQASDFYTRICPR